MLASTAALHVHIAVVGITAEAVPATLQFTV
jgi:hypothetical protein